MSFPDARLIISSELLTTTALGAPSYFFYAIHCFTASQGDGYWLYCQETPYWLHHYRQLAVMSGWSFIKFPIIFAVWSWTLLTGTEVATFDLMVVAVIYEPFTAPNPPPLASQCFWFQVRTSSEKPADADVAKRPSAQQGMLRTNQSGGSTRTARFYQPNYSRSDRKHLEEGDQWVTLEANLI